MAFIILFGVVSLFSDLTHEGASSIRGAYLTLLGASAGTIGFISGLGEMIGHSMRYASGRIPDGTRRYWPMTILGYVLDVAAVPLFIGIAMWGIGSMSLSSMHHLCKPGYVCQSAPLGQFLTHSMQWMHSVPFFRLRELSVTFTSMGHTRLHFPQEMHFSLSHLIRKSAK